ncbi:16S rRNA (uracil(1498)-N(3))-methyltransferase [Galbibacter mesophilus]|uniref:16S rRNA (uracil(1498)-N(3))-methyltransferase n=1 Tax=Galbibacter mesophilus TaxID=379069 RepID=UPI00191D39FC|nr:16S rRNA (uracil(1498)-N(3))-methyltransferase [Galbibacter mesophilus]MCM5663740.1 16S rRNA (uracil(1498)-N(3))-methyltransferase [Galbibacter mesophilus]
MQLFYAPELANDAAEYTFDKEESRHISKVLRKKEGDTLYITNGKGWLFDAEITNADIKNCVVSIKKAQQKRRKQYRLHMAVAPTKMNDRYEWFLEKATEIGIDEITPIICDHSERKKIKPERYEKILQAAMKQSLTCYLPKLNEAINYADFMKEKQEGQLFIAHCENQEKYDLKRKIMADNEVVILIGPEGDFSLNEIKIAEENGYFPVSLSDNRLRTETAAIVACHIVSLMNS